MQRELFYEEVYELNWNALLKLAGAMAVSGAMWTGIIRGVLALVR
ncbi:MAG TPA: hypothetical protein VFA89_09125 [Terriglobales bacterium]|nr:hypothetical protein [Terriglobales bacterium]